MGGIPPMLFTSFHHTPAVVLKIFLVPLFEDGCARLKKNQWWLESHFFWGLCGTLTIFRFFLKPILPPVQIFDVFFNGEVSAGFIECSRPRPWFKGGFFSIETCPMNPALLPQQVPRIQCVSWGSRVPPGRTTMEEKWPGDWNPTVAAVGN